MRVLAHQDDFLPMYNRLQSQPKMNKDMLGAIGNIKQQLPHSGRPLGVHHKKKQIPQYYTTRYNLHALHHFDMPDCHRIVYTARRASSLVPLLLSRQ